MLKEVNCTFEYEKEDRNVLSFIWREHQMKARIFVLETDLIRVLFTQGESPVLSKTWSIAPGLEDVPFEGRNRLDTSGFTLPEYEMVEENNRFIVMTSSLRLEIDLYGFKIDWFFNKGGEWLPLAQDRKTQAYNLDGSLGKGSYHYLERSLQEDYYGLGEKTGALNKHGKRYRMFAIDAMGYDAESSDPLYKHIPFYITRNRETGLSFGLFYDHLSSSVFEMGSELDNYHGLYRYFSTEAEDLDYYIFAGERIKDVTERYTWMTGKTIMPPKWSLGYSGSTMSYTDAENAQEQLMQFLSLCQQHDILCDSFQLSSGYTSIEDKRYVFHWNRSKFPDPKAFTEAFHEHEVKLCANIKPALLIDHPLFDELAKQGMFIKNGVTKEPELAQFWDEKGAYLDFTNEKTFNWWKSQVKEQLLAYNIDSTWNDNNEFEIWSHAAVCGGDDDQPVDFDLIRGLHPLLMMKASYEAQIEHNPEYRPYLISRSGSPGMHRYVQTWTGDNRTSWKTLKYNIKMGIGLSLSGIYNFGHDVGGFSGIAPSPELFVRWIQNGVVHPRFTIHSWNDDQTVNEPWMYPEYLPAIRELIKFRAKLTPYLYTLFHEAYTENKPLVRPVFYDFENDVKTFEDSDDFMLGEALLIASVVEPGVTEREVYLPEHEAGWYDFHQGNWFEGKQTIKIPAPLNRVPLLVKGGSMLPVNLAELSFANKSDDVRGVLLFPAKGEDHSKTSFYEDDGLSNDFREGVFAQVNMEMETSDTHIKISIEKTGEYKLPYDRVTFILPETENRTIEVNGQEFGKAKQATMKVR